MSAGHPFFQEQPRQDGLGQGIEADHLAARDDGLELELGRGADQDQDRARRRLLQGLQEGVGRLVVHVVDVVDDGDLSLAPGGLETELGAEVADHADGQLLAILGPGDLEQVGVRARLDLHAAGTGAAGLEHGLGISLAEEGLGELPGEGPLADALGPDEQKRVVEPPAPQVRAERLDDPFMPADRVPGHAPPRF